MSMHVRLVCPQYIVMSKLVHVRALRLRFLSLSETQHSIRLTYRNMSTICFYLVMLADTCAPSVAQFAVGSSLHMKRTGADKKEKGRQSPDDQDDSASDFENNT